MIKFYYNTAPNPIKVALALEEMGLAYETVPVDSRLGDQHTEAFKAINPNAKVPVLVDDGTTIFDSNAILLWLGDKTGRFVPTDLTSKARGEMLSWLMFVASGVGPFSGQCVHFRAFAPEPKEYALNRYDFEANRHWQVIEDRLATGRYMLGDTYSIVDMAVWGWARMVPFVLGDKQAWDHKPNLKRLLDEINERPAALKVAELQKAHVFKTEMDDQAKKSMFPQNERLA
ncbi:MAG: glutathione S-transferase family protein [Burkholderiaceae bacterium]